MTWCASETLAAPTTLIFPLSPLIKVDLAPGAVQSCSRLQQVQCVVFHGQYDNLFIHDLTGFFVIAVAGNMVGLSIGGAIAMESGMKTVQQRLEGTGSELLYLMDRYS